MRLRHVVGFVLVATLTCSGFAQSSGEGPARAVPAREAIDSVVPDLEMDNASLGHVIDYLRNASGANLVVDWKTLEGIGVSKEMPITLQVHNVSLRKLLRLAFDQAGPSAPLSITVDQNVIDVTTQDQEDQHLVTRAYPVADLLIQPDNMIPPQLNLNQATNQGSGGGGGGSIFTQTNTQTNVTPATIGDQLATIIRNTVRPSVWKENGGNSSIQYFMGQLIVTAPVSVQEAIGGSPVLDRGETYGN